MSESAVRVECHSEWVYAQRPVALEWLGQRVEVKSVDQHWLAPDGRHFRMSCGQEQRFELIYSENEDTWRAVPA